MAMSAPSRANSAATARPMPLSAPGISATLSFNRREPGWRGCQSGLGSSWLSCPGSRSSWTIGSMTSDMAATPSRLHPCPPARPHQRLPRDSAPVATAFCSSRPLSVSGFLPPHAAPSRRLAYLSRFVTRLRCEQFAGVGPRSYVGPMATVQTKQDKPNAGFAALWRFLPMLWPKGEAELKARVVVAVLLVLAGKAVTLLGPY